MAITNWFGKNDASLPKPTSPGTWKPPLSTQYQGTGNNKNTVSSGKTGGSYRGNSGTPSGGGNPYGSILNSWYAQQQAAAEAAAAAKQQAAQDAYDRGMAALGNAYNSMLGNLQQNYDSSLGTLQDSYNSGVHGVNQQADKTQNEAYVNYMLTMRDMPQLLAAQGVNGGAAESTIAGMKNNYGTSRNNIDTDRNNSLADLLDQLNANKAAALQAFNASKSDLEAQRMAYQMQLESALAQGIADAANTKFDALSDIGSQYLTQAMQIAQDQAAASQKAAARTYTATNNYTTQNTQQGGSAASAGGAADGLNKYNSYLDAWYGAGDSTNQVLQNLGAMGLTAEQIWQIMGNY